MTEVLLLSVVLIWGANYSIGKYGVVQLSPIEFNTIRFLLAAPILLILSFFIDKSLRIQREDLKRLTIVSIVGITLYQTLYMLGIQYTSATNASLLIAISPIFSSFFAILSGQEQFSARVQTGSIIALIGAAMVLLFKTSASSLDYEHETLGNFFLDWWHLLLGGCIRYWPNPWFTNIHP